LFIGLDSFEAINPTTAGTTTVTSPVKLANPVRNSGTEGSTMPVFTTDYYSIFYR